MLFETVTVGETVLLPLEIKVFSYSRKTRTVYIPAPVEKVTKTQITVKGERYSRQYGTRVGSYGSTYKADVYPVNYKVPGWGGGTIITATPAEQVAALKAGVKAVRTLHDLAERVVRNTDILDALLDSPEKIAEMAEINARLTALLAD